VGGATLLALTFVPGAFVLITRRGQPQLSPALA
jgi:hypothetical protein